MKLRILACLLIGSFSSAPNHSLLELDWSQLREQVNSRVEKSATLFDGGV